MECKEAQILLAPHIMGDLPPDSGRFDELEVHLLSCRECSKEYEGIKKTIKFIEEHRPDFAAAFDAIDRQKAAERQEIERGWKCIEAALDELEARKTKEKPAVSHNLLVRISAVAACLAIGISIWLVLSIYPGSPPPQVRSLPKPSVTIELISQNDNILIPPGRRITSNNQLKTLVINRKHRLTMNTGSLLTIDPLVENGNIGCLVKLLTGQVYANVEHDGNPFVVETAHAKAVITGTAFDVKVTDDITTLAVTEGTVRFESQKAVVEVPAGRSSKIIAQSAPTKPILCNTAELIAWASDQETIPPLARAKSDTEPWDLPLLLGQEPVVLDRTDYDSWVSWKRDWFRRQFTQVFQLKNALAHEGIEVDYPQLLIQSPSLWQFIFLEKHLAQFSFINPDTLIKMASHYGFDRRWLLKNVVVTEYETKATPTALKAFDQWLQYLDKAENLTPSAAIYSYRAAVYLAETRSLLWFAVKAGAYDLTQNQRTEILTLLQQQVTAAYKCQNDALYPPDESELSCEDVCPASVDRIIEHIQTMKALEERLTEYEISK